MPAKFNDTLNQDQMIVTEPNKNPVTLYFH